MIQTTSLETSKLLKEAGFRQDTSFYWDRNDFCKHGGKERYVLVRGMPSGSEDKNWWFAALTTDELLAELPKQFKGNELNIYFNKYKVWECGYIGGGFGFQDDRLCEALAQMWLWLKKEELL